MITTETTTKPVEEVEDDGEDGDDVEDASIDPATGASCLREFLVAR